jgi:hypothetical protein
MMRKKCALNEMTARRSDQTLYKVCDNVQTDRSMSCGVIGVFPRLTQTTWFTNCATYCCTPLQSIAIPTLGLHGLSRFSLFPFPYHLGSPPEASDVGNKDNSDLQSRATQQGCQTCRQTRGRRWGAINAVSRKLPRTMRNRLAQVTCWRACAFDDNVKGKVTTVRRFRDAFYAYASQDMS